MTLNTKHASRGHAIAPDKHQGVCPRLSSASSNVSRERGEKSANFHLNFASLTNGNSRILPSCATELLSQTPTDALFCHKVICDEFALIRRSLNSLGEHSLRKRKSLRATSDLPVSPFQSLVQTCIRKIRCKFISMPKTPGVLIPCDILVYILSFRAHGQGHKASGKFSVPTTPYTTLKSSCNFSGASKNFPSFIAQV